MLRRPLGSFPKIFGARARGCDMPERRPAERGARWGASPESSAPALGASTCWAARGRSPAGATQASPVLCRALQGAAQASLDQPAHAKARPTSTRQGSTNQRTAAIGDIRRGVRRSTACQALAGWQGEGRRAGKGGAGWQGGGRAGKGEGLRSAHQGLIGLWSATSPHTAETRDRTGDLQIFSLTLPQLSYRGYTFMTRPPLLKGGCPEVPQPSHVL